MSIPEISAKDAHEALAKNPATKLIDVRTDEEYEIANIPGAILVNSQPQLDEILKLPLDTPLIIHCHHGVRSLSAAQFFIQKGFTNVASMAGGISAWSTTVDSTIPQY